MGHRRVGTKAGAQRSAAESDSRSTPRRSPLPSKGEASRRILVQKYGGSSVATTAAIRKVARKVATARETGFDVVVVVSAMGGSTDELVSASREVASDPDRRELDALLAVGEQTTTALLALALRDLGTPAISLTGPQSGILTNDVHGNARILEIRPRRVFEELEGGRVVVVAGFQGMSPDGEVTTLGRGGSDTSAVALAAALGAEHCDIYTDVEGVWSADPRVVATARPIEVLHHDEMEAMGWHGARVLKAEAVEFARDNGVRIRVLSTFRGDRMTRVESRPPADERRWQPRRLAVAGVAGRRDLVRLTIRFEASLEVDPGLDQLIAPYDLVYSHLDAAGRRCELYLSTEEMTDAGAFRDRLAGRFGDSLEVSQRLGAVSVVGFGIGSRPADLLAALEVMRRNGVEVIGTFSEREAVTLVVPVEQVDDGVHLLHRAFVEEAGEIAAESRG